MHFTVSQCGGSGGSNLHTDQFVENFGSRYWVKNRSTKSCCRDQAKTFLLSNGYEVKSVMTTVSPTSTHCPDKTSCELVLVLVIYFSNTATSSLFLLHDNPSSSDDINDMQ